MSEKRRKELEEIRERLGDGRFADFVIDMTAGNGHALGRCDLPFLVDVWLEPAEPADG